MRLIVILIMGLYFSEAFGLDSETQEWLSSMQKSTQGADFMH